jgi:hypothetical protein
MGIEAILSGSKQGGKEFLLLLELDEIGIEAALPIVLFDFALALLLEEADGPEHNLSRTIVRIEAGGVLGVEKHVVICW